VATSGGCAAHLASVLGTERVKEFSQWLLARGGAAAGKPAGGRLRIGLQDSCHLRNGLGVWREPRELIARVGEYVELPSAAACCGAAGSYAVVRPKDSARVLDPHLDEIADADLDVIAVVNAGCYRQLEQGVKRRGLRTASSTSPSCWRASSEGAIGYCPCARHVSDRVMRYAGLLGWGIVD